MKKEVDLYEPIKIHFEERGFDVFAEVVVPHAGGRIDVVAASGPAVVAIELKQGLSVELIGQALKRKRVAHYVYIAIFERRKPPESWLLEFLDREGIGIMEVGEEGARISRRAKFNRPTKIGRKLDWTKILRPEHQTWLPGGSAGGGYVTAYAMTMKGIRHYLSRSRVQDSAVELWNRDRKNPGWRTVNEILEYCETHYHTPKNSLGKALQEFESSWCEVKVENRKRYFRHK